MSREGGVTYGLARFGGENGDAAKLRLCDVEQLPGGTKENSMWIASDGKSCGQLLLSNIDDCDTLRCSSHVSEVRGTPVSVDSQR